MLKRATILAINTGSSSIKFRLFSVVGFPAELLSGKIILADSTQNFTVTLAGGQQISYEAKLRSVTKAAQLLLKWLNEQIDNYAITAIGYRVVHGGLKYNGPERINLRFINELKKITALAPLHLPDAITTMKIFYKAFPSVKQIACFDTNFHEHLPFEARHFALPRNLWKEGILRYGFHGLSCQYIMDHLLQTEPSLIGKKIIIVHLGSGCSITAIKNNNSIDTTMGLTPSGGVMMNTRPGDLDPGVILYLLKYKKMSATALDKLINQDAGLKAITGTGDSIAELLKKENTDIKSAEAIKMFCYQVKKQIGALTAALEGLDILVFTGGIGEHEPVIRERICDGLKFLGIDIDKEINSKSAEDISSQNNLVSVRIVPTNEELVIAKTVFNIVFKPKKKLV